jgi:hypothetical protein
MGGGELLRIFELPQGPLLLVASGRYPGQALNRPVVHSQRRFSAAWQNSSERLVCASPPGRARSGSGQLTVSRKCLRSSRYRHQDNLRRRGTWRSRCIPSGRLGRPSWSRSTARRARPQRVSPRLRTCRAARLGRKSGCRGSRRSVRRRQGRRRFRFRRPRSQRARYPHRAPVPQFRSIQAGLGL